MADGILALTASKIWIYLCAHKAQIVWVNTACGKDHNQKNVKTIVRYRSVCNQIASDVLRNQNHVCKLTMNKLQPVLLNVLITTFFEY